jgi:transcriptional regulator with XRE-family HTH domain
MQHVKKEELSKKIGNRIVELRERKGWSQADLGRALMKDRQNIERLENGKTNPTVFTLHEIAQVLEISLKEFFQKI